MLVRMGSSLALVLGLMFLLAAAAKRVLGGRLPAAAGAPPIRVLGSGYLGPRKAVSLVSVAGELFVIGTTHSDIVPIGRLSDQEAAKRWLREDGPPLPIEAASPWMPVRRLWQQWSRGAAATRGKDEHAG